MFDLPSIVRAISDWITRAPKTLPPLLADLKAPEFHDRRKYASQRHGPKKEWKVGRRSIKKTKGICLHQTACLLGERDERWDSVGAHFGIKRSGTINWLHDFDRVVAAANGWNPQTISIEVDGLMFGVDGDQDTVWDDPSTPQREQGMQPTPEQMRSLEWLIQWICDEVKKRGGKITVLVSHRQSSKNRRNDPGSFIWRGTRVIAAKLGLTDGGRGYEIGGYPNPEEWDDTRKGIRY